jgi:DNA mismatch repair protein MutS
MGDNGNTMSIIQGTSNSLENFSLLRPGTVSPDHIDQNGVAPNVAKDLGWPSVLAALGIDEQYRDAQESLFLNLTTNKEVIRYRQDVLDDILTHPELTAQIGELLPLLASLSSYQRGGSRRVTTNLHEVTWRLGELESIVVCVHGLHQALSQIESEIHSAGLQALFAEIQAIEADATFKNLVKELPGLLEEIRAIKSITIGVNLDGQLRPVEATLVSVNKSYYRDSNILSRLFGGSKSELQGITPLHSVPGLNPEGDSGTGTPIGYQADRPQITPKMVPLLRDLAEVLDKVCDPILNALRQYVHINGRFFANLHQDFLFYLTAVRLIHKVRDLGFPICRPEIASMAERTFQVDDLYNLNLVLHLSYTLSPEEMQNTVISNDVAMGENGRIFILTGPNLGGKTTYIQAIGLVQVLAQAGLYVPGKQARISPVDTILTHFPVEERLESGTGRFGDEARRLGQIFQHATRHSLLLFNESLASTSFGESFYLAQDLVRIMRRMGLRAVFATHMHELAESVAELNEQETGDSVVISVVASRIDPGEADSTVAKPVTTRSYQIKPGPPMGKSYARELARRYGISYDQLADMLNERENQ